MLKRDAVPGPATVAGAVALLFAVAARLPYFLHSDFPLNDGGMFLAMSRDIFNAHFSLPAYASYNFESIPFAYPPLSFYLLAIFHGLSGLDFTILLRYIPLLANFGTVVAVGLLARALLGSGWSAWIAPAMFAVLPRSYEWMIMGGGLTRSIGFMFAVLCLSQAVELFRRPSVWRTLGCGLLASAAVASHLEMAVFVVYSLIAMAILSARSLRAVLLAVAVILLSIVYTMPWWATVVVRFGLAPFDAASLTSYWSTISQALDAAQEYMFPSGFLFSAIGVAAALGALACLVRGEFFLPFWLPAIFVWIPRSAQSEATVPMALLTAAGLAEVVAPGLRSVVERAGPPVLSATSASLSLVHRPLPLLSYASRLLEAAGIMLMLVAAFVYSPRMHADPTVLDSLSDGDRQAMAWVAQNTPPDAQFLVLSTTWAWEQDNVGEWFPVIAQRRSLLTPQGTEWLPAESFARNQCLFYSARALPQKGVSYTDEWARDRGLSYSYIYVSKKVRGSADWSSLLQSAESSPNYKVVFDGPGATVLARQQPIQPFWAPPGQVLVSRDCQSLADQPASTQTEYLSAYGQMAPWEWVQRHDEQLSAPSTLCGKLDGVGLGQIGVIRSVCRVDARVASAPTASP